MYTIKPVLDKRRKLNSGLYPIKLRITCNRTSWYINMNLEVYEKSWNHATSKVKTSHPNHKLYNLKISTKLIEVESAIIKKDLVVPIQSLSEIKSLLTNNQQPQDFISHGNKMVKLMYDSERFGNANFYKQAVDKLQKYIGSSTMHYTQLNHGFINSWEASMKKEGIKQNSIAAYFRAIRAICNQMIKEEVVPQTWYPFKHYQIRTEETKNRNLSLEELQALFRYKPISLKEEIAKDLFFLSFSLIGMNFTDMAFLAKDDIQQGRLHYKRRKTHKNYSIKILEFSSDTIERLSKYSQSTYLLPIIMRKLIGPELKPYIAERNKQTNSLLKVMANQIGIKHLTTYYSRYTWVYLAQELGASKEEIAFALGHSSNNSVTDIYLSKPHLTRIDELNLQIIDLL